MITMIITNDYIYFELRLTLKGTQRYMVGSPKLIYRFCKTVEGDHQKGVLMLDEVVSESTSTQRSVFLMLYVFTVFLRTVRISLPKKYACSV